VSLRASECAHARRWGSDDIRPLELKLSPSLSLFDAVTLTHQALELIKVLQGSNVLPIARARMRVRVTMPSKEGKRLKDKVLPLIDNVEDEDWGDEWELVSARSWGVWHRHALHRVVASSDSREDVCPTPTSEADTLSNDSQSSVLPRSLSRSFQTPPRVPANRRRSR
jgi:hypothetical protein